MPATLRFLALVSLAALVVTCGKEATAPVRTVDMVLVSGRTALRLGEQSQLIAKAYDHSAQEMLGVAITWATLDPNVATVSTSGLVTTTGVGSTGITATAEGKTGTAPLQVTLVPVTRVDVVPAVDSLVVGDSLLLTATPKDSAGNPLTGRPVVWTTSDTAKATVTQGGMVLARRAETFAIRATSEGVVGGSFLHGQYPVVAIDIADSVTITFRSKVRFVPILWSAAGTPIGNRVVSWTTPDPAVLTVAADGLVTPAALGSGRVVASSEGVADTAVVVVQSEPVKTMTLFTDQGSIFSGDTLFPGDSVHIRASPTDPQGFPVTAFPYTWASTDSSVALVRPDSADSSRVTITALSVGTSEITVSAGGVGTHAHIQVRHPTQKFVVTPDSIIVHVGNDAQLYYSFRDTFDILTGYPVSLSTTLTVPGVISTNCCFYVHGLAPGRTSIAWHASPDGVNYFDDTTNVEVVPNATPRLFWADQGASVPELSEDIATLVLLDSTLAPLPGGKDVVLTSSDTTVLTVTPALIPAASGVVLVHLAGKRPGSAQITAATDSLYDILPATVFDNPVVIFHLVTKPSIVHEGDTIPLTVVATDYAGRALAYSITWSSTDSAVATVNDSGRVVAVAPGYARIRVSAENQADSTDLTVQSTNAPVISGFTPGILVAGQPATIAGSGFDAVPANNLVSIRGVGATVVTAATDRLDVQLPPGTSFPCEPTRTALVTVISGGRLAADSVPLTVARQVALSPGQAMLLLGPGESGCNEISQTGGSYAVTVVNPTPSPTAVAAFELRGAGATAIQATTTAALAAPPPESQDAQDGPASLDDRAVVRRARQVHQRILEGNRLLPLRVGPPAPLLRAAFRPLSSVADSVGAFVRFHVPSIERPDFCESHTTITARRAYTGTHVVIFEDITAPEAGTVDIDYLALGAEFDNVMYPKLLANFGNPLALDSLLDRNGKLVMLFTPIVNRVGVGGFVVSCDFYPETVAPSSNVGEVFYAFVPTNGATGFALGNAAYWRWLVRTIIMHESKHLAAFAERLSRGLPLEDTWLEEGSAVLAEEIWARTIYGNGWKVNAGYGATLSCEVRPTSPNCTGRPYAMFNAFAFLFDHAYPAREAHSVLGPTTSTDATFYGASWSFLRWATDQYAVSESAFLTALTQSPQTGVANIEARTGRDLTGLLADWSMASYTDDLFNFTPLRNEHVMPSWNSRDIFAGINRDFPSDFPIVFPFVAHPVPFGSFLQGVASLHGGSAAIFFIGGAQFNRQLLDLRAPGGGPPPPQLRMEIVRIQ